MAGFKLVLGLVNENDAAKSRIRAYERVQVIDALSPPFEGGAFCGEQKNGNATLASPQNGVVRVDALITTPGRAEFSVA